MTMRRHALRVAADAGGRRLLSAFFLWLLVLCATTPGHAQTSTQPPSGQPSSGSDESEPGFFTGLFAPSRSNLLGDMFGLRTFLGNYGITLNLTDTDEVLGNLAGGIRRGATYEGLTTLTVQLDTLKAFGWAGGTFNISGLQIRGRNLSQYYLDNLQTASGIEADDTTRLWEIWYDQAFLDNKADVKIGQQSLDQEFIISQGSSLFINTMMGWPLVPSVDMYAGGPAYPLSSLGVRLRVQPGGGFTVLGGVFQDNPPGGQFNNDSQLLGTTEWGGNFNLRTGALFIAELQYALNQPSTGQMARPGQQSGLPGTYKLGFWYDTAPFPSPRFDNTGLSLANPNSDGVPVTLLHNWSIYGVMDQVVWQPDPLAARAVGVFARLMGAPGDRNLIDFSANGGVTLKAPLPGRDSDTFGVGFGFAKLSGAAVGLSQDTGFYTQNPSYPVRSSETFIEITYQAQVAPWLQVQPDFQYVFNPGGGIPNPNNPTQRLGNELILGVRTNVTF
jgi:porin